MISLIDTHQHLVYRNEISYGWTKGIPPLAVDDFTIENYKSLTKDLCVVGTIFMETGVDDHDYQKETRYVKSLQDKSNSNIMGMISSIRPENDEEFDSWLNETLDMGVTGYRRILHDMPNETSQSETFRKNIRKIGDAGKPFDICFLSSQLKIAKELAIACDNTQVILNHCGIPTIANNELDPWREDMEALSKIPNVTCKLSGLMAYCAPGTSSYETIEPYVDHALKCYGPKRMLWGSDWPVVNLGKGLVEWIEVTRKILSKLSPDEAEDIANRTAQKIYKVNL